MTTSVIANRNTIWLNGNDPCVLNKRDIYQVLATNVADTIVLPARSGRWYPVDREDLVWLLS